MQHFDATELPRLMQCGASKSMPGFHPPGIDDRSSANEGTAAHWLAHEGLKGNDITQWADRKAPNGVWIDDAMVSAVSYYLDQVSKRPTQQRYAEQPFTLTFGDVTINARPDLICDDLKDQNRRIYIDEFKYGWRTVEAQDNWQLIAYAATYLSQRVIDPDTAFVMTIHQPRPYHPLGKSRTWYVGAYELHDLRNYMLQQLMTARTDLVTGPHCYKCPARSNCPAIREAAMNVMDVATASVPDNMSPDDLSMMMDTVTRAEHIIKDYKDALSERIVHSLGQGQVVRNYRMVPTEGRTTWADYMTPDMLRMLAPDKPVIKETMITPKQAMKFVPESVVNGLVNPPSSGLKLVRSDTNQTAAHLFGKTGE